MRPLFRHWLSAGVIGSMLVTGCNQTQRQPLAYRPSTPVALTPSYSEGAVDVLPAPEPPQPTASVKEDSTPASLPTAAAAQPDKEMVPASFVSQKEETVKRRSFADITAKPGFAHADDYTWLKGELQYVHVRNAWKLRYASLEDEDRYGGSVTLVEMGSMAKFSEGQMVRVEGNVIDVDSHEAGPSFRVRSIELVPGN